MNTSHRLTALVAVTSLALVGACGDSESDTAASTEPAPTEPAPTTGPTTAGPVTSGDVGDGSAPAATVAPDLPPEFAGQVGPLAVVGDPLPRLELGADEPRDDDPAFGTPAPVLAGENFDGAAVTVDAAADGPTMVVFLAHWCPHCNDEIPVINELRDEGRFPEGLDIVGVSTAVDPTRPNFPPSEWVVEKDWTYPIIADGVDMERETFIGSAAYGLSGFPFTTLIDADGNVAARWSGELGADGIIEMIDTYLDL